MVVNLEDLEVGDDREYMLVDQRTWTRHGIRPGLTLVTWCGLYEPSRPPFKYKLCRKTEMSCLGCIAEQVSP